MKQLLREMLSESFIVLFQSFRRQIWDPQTIGSLLEFASPVGKLSDSKNLLNVISKLSLTNERWVILNTYEESIVYSTQKVCNAYIMKRSHCRTARLIKPKFQIEKCTLFTITLKGQKLKKDHYVPKQWSIHKCINLICEGWDIFWYQSFQ